MEQKLGKAAPRLVAHCHGTARPEAWAAIWETLGTQARPSGLDTGHLEGSESGPLHTTWLVLQQASLPSLPLLLPDFILVLPDEWPAGVSLSL